MLTRTYSIPSIAALGLSMTTGCAEPIIGTWNVTEITIGTETYQIPYTYSYTYEGATYVSETDFTMTVNDELTGDWIVDYSYTGPDGSENDTYTYDIEVTKTSKATYDIEIGGIDFSGSCTVASTELTCTGSDGEDDIEFTADIAQ